MTPVMSGSGAIEALDACSNNLESALDALVSSTDWWLDLPLAFSDEEIEAMENSPKPLRMEVPCGFCQAAFWPINTVLEHEGERYNSFNDWCYYQAGYWFGDPGNGRRFPVCSDGCHDALKRLLEKRRVHTAQEMQKIAHARRLLRECKSAVRRLRSAQRVERCTAVGASSQTGHQVVGRPDRVLERSIG